MRLRFRFAYLLVAALFSFSLGLANFAHAATRALLIGVSDYKEGLGIKDLRGPLNDVRLLRDTLTELGVTDITVLSEEGGEAVRPTRAAIENGFARLAEKAKPGDVVFIHFSGHGTRQRDQNGDETDGLDEIFLPADTTPAKPGVGVIGNAIVDDELGKWVHAIRKTGADVWISIDTCHSGSGLRDASGMLASRAVDREKLGLPPIAPETVQSANSLITQGAESEERLGGVMAFYSAKSDEVAREINFGKLSGDRNAKGPWYGLFTARLADRLKRSPGLTYRELFQAVLRDLNEMPLPKAARLQTPSWVGTMPGKRVFGERTSKSQQTFIVRDAKVFGGLAEGVTRGSVVQLFSDVGGTKPVGVAQVVEVGGRQSNIQSVAADCVAGPTLCPVTDNVSSEARFARISKSAPATITFSSIVQHPGEDTSTQAIGKLEAQLQAAVHSLQRNSNYRISLNAEKPDVRVSYRKGQLWFGKQVEVGEAPAGLSWSAGGKLSLETVLRRIAFAEQVSARLASLGTENLLNPSPINSTVSYRPSDPNKLAAKSGEILPTDECLTIIEKDSFGDSQILERSSKLKQCDLIEVSAQGALPGARDVNLVHIDANFCVTAQYTRVDDMWNATGIGAGLQACSDCPGGYSAGKDRMYLVVSEVMRNREPLNLEGVIENCTADPASNSNSGRSQAFRTSLFQGRETRSVFEEDQLGTLWVEPYSWLVLPRQQALKARNP